MCVTLPILTIKIIARANENNETITELTNRFILAMNQDAQALGCIDPDAAPRATEFIPRNAADDWQN